MQTIGVIGAGAWGTALAQTLSVHGKDVSIWAREPETVTSINNAHINKTYLPDIPLSETLRATNDLNEIVKCDILLLVAPAQHTRSTLESIKDLIKDNQPIVICSKGIELNTGLLLSQVAEQTVPNAMIAILSGPTFASEVAKGLPGAYTIATKIEDDGKYLQDALGVKHFRPYITQDVIGAQLGGAIKNVIAIACGIITGREMGENARAALLTRGVAEIARLGGAMNAQKDTLLGMCGIGDLMLTCSSMQSRNFALGVQLGEGKTLDDILGKGNTTEGVHTAKAVLNLAKKHNVDMPISEAISKCLHEGASIDEAIKEMLERPFGDETTNN